MKTRVAIPAADPPDNSRDRPRQTEAPSFCLVLPCLQGSMFNFASLRGEWLSNPRGDILARIVVALALIPEAIGFSVIAGVDPRVGLFGSFSIAVITALVGGRPC